MDQTTYFVLFCLFCRFWLELEEAVSGLDMGAELGLGVRDRFGCLGWGSHLCESSGDVVLGVRSLERLRYLG